MSKEHWTIWNIKNKTLRAAAAAVIFVVGFVVFAILGILIVAWSAIKGLCVGVYDGAGQFWNGFYDPYTWKAWWRVITMRDQT